MTIKRGMQGQAVGDLQQKLVEIGYVIAHDELADERFGDTTDTAVRAFQTSQELTVDGLVGPKTLAALAVPTLPYVVKGWRCRPSEVLPSVYPVIQGAFTDVGRFEQPDGSNDGPMLRKYKTGGQPWCAYACSYWFSLLDSGSPFGRIGATWDLYDWAVKRGRVLGDGDAPQPGDVGLILRANRHGHTMLIVDASTNGVVSTIAGNEANAVRGNLRILSVFTKIIRPIPVL
jgi:hypothetical protein